VLFFTSAAFLKGFYVEIADFTNQNIMSLTASVATPNQSWKIVLRSFSTIRNQSPEIRAELTGLLMMCEAKLNPAQPSMAVLALQR